MCVSVSYCCCNKLPDTWWFKTTQIYYLIVQEIRNLKWVSLAQKQAAAWPVFLLESLGKILVPCLFQPLEATHILCFWLIKGNNVASLNLSRLSSCLCHSLPLLQPLVITLWVHWIIRDNLPVLRSVHY